MTTTFTLPDDAEATAPPEWQGLERDEVRLMAVRAGRRHHAPVPRPARPARARRPRGDQHVRDAARPAGRPPGRRRRRPAALVDHAGRRELGGGGPPPGQRRAGPRRRARIGARPARRRPRHPAQRLIPTPPGPAGSGGPAPTRPWRPTTCSGTAGRSATATSRARSPWPPSRTSTRPSRAAPRWPAPAGRSPTGCSTHWPPAASRSSPITLHTGVSSPELHEPPYPERFAVPEVTARLVTGTRAAGRRVVAVGTTVTRALETATDDDGVTRPSHRVDRSRPRPRPPGSRRHRPDHRPARARGQPSAAARGRRRAGPRAGGLRGGRRRALPLARVRRLDALPP